MLNFKEKIFKIPKFLLNLTQEQSTNSSKFKSFFEYCEMMYPRKYPVKMFYGLIVFENTDYRSNPQMKTLFIRNIHSFL